MTEFKPLRWEDMAKDTATARKAQKPKPAPGAMRPMAVDTCPETRRILQNVTGDSFSAAWLHE